MTLRQEKRLLKNDIAIMRLLRLVSDLPLDQLEECRIRIAESEARVYEINEYSAEG